ncbi:MAG TPA: von Willebrand factor type A domain-containing protein, partial [Pirellulaceae bacterium]|nr:von Willebrand factor type A domain-containing protein [Pirellulaceae bacterium]
MVRARFLSLVMIIPAAAAILGCGAEGVHGPAGDAASPAVQRELREIDASRYAAPASEAPMNLATTPAPTASAQPAAETAPAEGVLLGGKGLPMTPADDAVEQARIDQGRGPGEGGDKFAYIDENPFLAVKDTPLSTFSIDVDTASYAKTRAYLLEHHSLPP